MKLHTVFFILGFTGIFSCGKGIEKSDRIIDNKICEESKLDPTGDTLFKTYYSQVGTLERTTFYGYDTVDYIYNDRGDLEFSICKKDTVFFENQFANNKVTQTSVVSGDSLNYTISRENMADFFIENYQNVFGGETFQTDYTYFDPENNLVLKEVSLDEIMDTVFVIDYSYNEYGWENETIIYDYVYNSTMFEYYFYNSNGVLAYIIVETCLDDEECKTDTVKVGTLFYQ